MPEDIGVEVPKEISMAASARTFRRRNVLGGQCV